MINRHRTGHGRTQRGAGTGSSARRREKAAGFTLLEILIAISIFAVVVTTIFGSFHFVFGNIDAIDNAMTDYEMAGDGLHRMQADLRTLYIALPPGYVIGEDADSSDPYRLVGDVVDTGAGAFSRLRFTSFSHLPMGRQWRQGIAEIIYYVEEQTDGSGTLKRSDRIEFNEPPEQERNDPILCENVRALKITYIDADRDERDRWDSDSEEFEYATPRAIRIQIAVGSGQLSHEFEVLIALPVYRDNPEASRFQTIPSDFGSGGA